MENLSYFELTQEAESVGIDYMLYDNRSDLEQAIIDKYDMMAALEDW